MRMGEDVEWCTIEGEDDVEEEEGEHNEAASEGALGGDGVGLGDGQEGEEVDGLE